VQDRHAAPAVTRALQDLAACAEVEVVVVARGGGSLADLFAFCDETLCRTVALLRVPVIASVGHHTDRTLLDDVAAVACSTPTHAAEAAVPVDCTAARAALVGATARLERQGRRAVVDRARTLARLSRAPAHHVARHRARLHQQARELRAVTRRAVLSGDRATAAHATNLARKARAAGASAERAGRAVGLDATALDRSATAALERRRRDLDRVLATLAAHDPQRTLERGYALLEDPSGEPVTSAASARSQPALTIRLHDGRVRVRPEDETPSSPRLPGL
jgi:exodeoxyribonuclease VII large subunit